MGQPYIGEIRLFGGNFAPFGWAFCNGAIMSIAQNTAMFQLLGTSYGGDGQSTFGLPDLQGRVPIHQGQGAGLSSYVMGQTGGTETVTLTAAQLPQHSHAAVGSGGNPVVSPLGATWGNSGITNKVFGPGTSANNSMNPASLASNSGGQPHDNVVPFLAVAPPPRSDTLWRS